MVVMALPAPAVPVVAGRRAQHIHLAGVGEGLQGAVDGGQPDRSPVVPQHRVQFLGGVETLGSVQQLAQGRPLLSAAELDHVSASRMFHRHAPAMVLPVPPRSGGYDQTRPTGMNRNPMPTRTTAEPRWQNGAMYASIVESLLGSAEPAIRWKIRSGVLGEPAGSAAMRALRAEVRE